MLAAIAMLTGLSVVAGSARPARAQEYLDLPIRRIAFDEAAAGFASEPASPLLAALPVFEPPVVIEAPLSAEASPPDPLSEPRAAHEIGYDRGLYLQYVNPRGQSFQLKTNARIQLRHVAFSRDRESWTDHAGVTREIRNRNYFDIERTRWLFSGHAWAPELKYFVQLDGDTDDGHTVEFFDFWWGYEFSEACEIQFGKRKVPAVRNWLLPAFETRLVDRPLAADFFRPDRTVGVWLVGQPTEQLHYELMAGDAYRATNAAPAELDGHFAFAGTVFWDPWGPFGNGIVDFETSCSPRCRVGHSWAYARQSGSDDFGHPLRESDFLRLSDGTRLTQLGALAPGATVDRYDVLLNAADFALKYQGWSLNAEYFWQVIGRIRADRPVPYASLFQHGCYVEAGAFVIPERLELNAHYSRVSGEFATRHEYTGGFRWYFGFGKHFQFACDVTALDGSPLNNTASDILAGDHGLLFRSQIQGTF